MIIQAFRLKLTKEEVLEHISPSVVKDIKSRGKNAYFQAYSLVHEGVSKPKVIQDGADKEVSWPRAAVESLKGIIRKGLQFFDGHGDTNDTAGRRPLATVVSDFTKEVGGKLHHIVVGHFPDKKTADKYDVCSIEADVDVAPCDNGGYIAQKIANITGIALGNSSVDTPGFPGAKRLIAVQAFEPEDKKTKKEGDSTMPTFHEIKQAVKDMNIYAHQLYSEEDLKDDRVFGKLYTQLDQEREKISTAETKLQDMEKSLKEEQHKRMTLDASNRLDSVIPDGATELQKKFYKRMFRPENIEDLSDEGLKTFVDTQEKQFQDLAKEGLIRSEDFSGGDKEPEGASNGSSDGDSEDVSTEEQLDSLVQQAMES